LIALQLRLATDCYRYHRQNEVTDDYAQDPQPIARSS